MKKILLITVFSLLSFWVQNRAYASGYTITYFGNDYTSGNLYLTFDAGNNIFSVTGIQLKNNGTLTKKVKVQRDVKTVVSGTQNYFCWDVCYDSLVNSSTAANGLNIAPGGTSWDFIADYLPNGHVGTTVIRYYFSNVNDPTDTTSIMIHFQGTPTDIRELNQSAGLRIGSMTPNPASDQVMINVPGAYSGNVQIDFVNILGQSRKTVSYSAGQKNSPISIADLAAGVYLVTLRVNNQVADIKRLIVE